MIIFDLDGTLADCEHRRGYVDPTKSVNHILQGYDGNGKMIEETGVYCNIIDGKRFKPNWKAFYEECDKDIPIEPVILTMRRLSQHDEIQIWSGRCESVRDKTVDWLYHKIPCFCPMSWFDKNLKMRPIGDSTPDDVLKERWLDEALGNGEQISFVVDDRPKVVRMWRRRGIFVFDVNQSGKEF